ncbi:MAG: DUF3501 family protein [Dehalococcoidia bacterium]|nr:DUF3501 family protein [Dehalococcoidia bacterium]
MLRLERSDLWSLSEYEVRRVDFRRRIIDLKKRRRVQVGQLLSFIFENRDTVQFQVQETLRAELVSDPERVQEELDIYNTLLPASDELSATLFIEVQVTDRLSAEMARLQGLDRAVYLEIGSERVRGVFEEGRSTEQALSTVQYVKFPLTPSLAEAFRAGKDRLALVVDHPNYRELSVLSPETRLALAGDLEG